MKRRPDNWDQMDCHAQWAWEKNERAREDLDYEYERTQRDLEDSRREQRRADEHRAAMEINHARERDALFTTIAEANSELDLAMKFLKDKGLAAEFDDWASYRRME